MCWCLGTRLCGQRGHQHRLGRGDGRPGGRADRQGRQDRHHVHGPDVGHGEPAPPFEAGQVLLVPLPALLRSDRTGHHDERRQLRPLYGPVPRRVPLAAAAALGRRR